MKSDPRAEIEDRIFVIRETHRILLNSESRDAVTDGMLANIGELLNEVDYWRSEHDRINRAYENQSSQINQDLQYDDIAIANRNSIFRCPTCNRSYEQYGRGGISWVCLGRMKNEQGRFVDVGYVKCSECGKISPLYIGKESAYYSWCIEERLEPEDPK